MTEDLVDHDAVCVFFVNRCKIFEMRYDLNFISVTHDFTIKSYKKTSIVDDLIAFCDDVAGRFDDLSIVSNSS